MPYYYIRIVGHFLLLVLMSVFPKLIQTLNVVTAIVFFVGLRVSAYAQAPLNQTVEVVKSFSGSQASTITIESLLNNVIKK